MMNLSMLVLLVMISMNLLLVMNLLPMTLVFTGRLTLITVVVKLSKYQKLLLWKLTKNVLTPYLIVGMNGLNGVLVRELVMKPINGEDKSPPWDYLLVVNPLLFNIDLVI
jgi:hypothetical protein